MKLTQEQLERIEYAIGFLDGAGCKVGAFLKPATQVCPSCLLSATV